MPGRSTRHIYIRNGTIITPSRTLFDVFLVFVVAIHIFLLGAWNSYKSLCFSFIKSEIITNFVTVTINCYLFTQIGLQLCGLLTPFRPISIINNMSIITIIQITIIIIVIIIITTSCFVHWLISYRFTC